MARIQLRYSPIIPTVASFLLAALWVLSVFADWGLEAFCAGGETASACSRRLAAVSTVSALFAALAACATAAAWLFPWSRSDPRTFGRVMGASVACWVVAEGVLFLGGLMAR
ncbi:hypothetical protein FH608_029555 [Nonomuraea phyllanthi]|uniref:Uncharacterized protein n=1 Tax=Nonomuraea phyllanthi TaxID=2219224 RepID=A0A5C4W3R2_9ACTN|nr:hypothetical protein [Nonomuraea phyllanthi]KAB8191413.1 hypothetical protein FH608_029555 [Nonomuraea phyllanthi]QFY13260.1 hypothetical protein GBF35_47795 [Nonomuraea phyllanthi]